jgi:hypothetical protein
MGICRLTSLIEEHNAICTKNWVCNELHICKATVGALLNPSPHKALKPGPACRCQQYSYVMNMALITFTDSSSGEDMDLDDH